ncbi:hypothetical protein ACFPOE_14630 [Caenimonas terrae]|uniref:Toxin CptA n=1 Tax=Caenimonas terrae TaxID=696074 RepID=A0ABW0NE25_9BURK
MHNAPAVTYPVARPRFAGLLAAALWLAGVAVALLWVLAAANPGWRQALAAAVLAMAGGWVLASWLRSPQGNLRWDGTAWTATFDAGPGDVEAAMDLQRCMLVRWSSPSSSRWLWLERSRDPRHWLDLRRAVYSRPRPPARPPARPPVATP